jgi:hypothetical protein
MADFIRSSVAALYVHGDRSSRPEDREPTPMLSVERVDVVPERGIKQDRRYFHAADPGRVRKRQVSVIDEGTLLRHEDRFGPFDRRFVKSQVILAGDVRLPDMIGATLEFEDGPTMVVAIEREPCFAMDLIAPGMRDAMEGGEQGALVMVTRAGPIYVGQPLTIRADSRERSLPAAAL